MLRIGVLASGNGTNLQAIINEIEKGNIDAKIVSVVSNKQSAFALERAKNHNIESHVFNKLNCGDVFEDKLIKHFKDKNVDLIVFAGFNLILSEKFINAFENKIMNIHPSLIPSFCGKGFYGLKVHEEVLKKGVKITGATVHFVDTGTDTGPIIAQKAIEVLDTDTPESLQKRVMEQCEWILYPQAIKMFAQANDLEKKKILVIGSGGREHAIIWKILKDNDVDIFCAPGNAGIEKIAKCVPIKATDIVSLSNFAKENNIDFTIVGMDDPLVLGIVDEFEKNNLKIFGPNAKAAMLEGSKVFSKNLMKKYNIPTAFYEVFENFDLACEFAKKQKYPIVVKVDGLAFGKGVIICNDYVECEIALREILTNKKFKTSGDKVVIEQFLTGPEVSILAFCDGKSILPMVSAKDHKRALDGDKGLNTGGMGTISPSREYSKEIADECMEKIFVPTLEAMIKENRIFKGIIFFGIMLTQDGPKVIEYNARFGDPETQVVLPRLKSNLLEVLYACVEGNLNNINLEWFDDAACCVMLASGGYPEDYTCGFEIKGLDSYFDEQTIIFHSGTKLMDEKFVTNGGRVLGVAVKADNLDDAIFNVYKEIDKIVFKKMQFRKDIGKL